MATPARSNSSSRSTFQKKRKAEKQAKIVQKKAEKQRVKEVALPKKPKLSERDKKINKIIELQDKLRILDMTPANRGRLTNELNDLRAEIGINTRVGFNVTTREFENERRGFIVGSTATTRDARLALAQERKYPTPNPTVVTKEPNDAGVIIEGQEGFTDPLTGKFVPQSREVAVASTSRELFKNNQNIKNRNTNERKDEKELKNIRNIFPTSNSRQSAPTSELVLDYGVSNVLPDVGNDRTFTGTYSPLSKEEALSQTIRARRQELGAGNFAERSAGTVFGGFAQSATDFGIFGKNLVTEPKKTASQIKTGVVTFASNPKREGKKILFNFGQNLRQDPGGVIGAGIFEFGAGKGITKITGTAIKTSVRATEFINPRFKGNLKPGDAINVVDAEVIIKTDTASTATPLREQAKVAGTRVTAVSAGTDFFDQTGLLKPKVVIDKPNAEGLKGAFFADPFGQVRTSRLGSSNPRSANLLDIVTGDFTLKNPKNQVIVFLDEPVAPLPKDIRSTFLSGSDLSQSQRKRLLQQQLTIKDEFQPIGFVGEEAEITLSPASTVQRVGSRGFFRFEGKRVDVFQAKTISNADAKRNSAFSSSESPFDFDALARQSARRSRRSRRSPDSPVLRRSPPVSVSSINRGSSAISSPSRVSSPLSTSPSSSPFSFSPARATSSSPLPRSPFSVSSPVSSSLLSRASRLRVPVRPPVRLPPRPPSLLSIPTPRPRLPNFPNQAKKKGRKRKSSQQRGGFTFSVASLAKGTSYRAPKLSDFTGISLRG